MLTVVHTRRLQPGAACLVLLLVLAGCGGSSGGSRQVVTPTAEPAPGLLRRVSGPAELEASLKSGFSRSINVPELADAPLAGAADSFTGTYTQEKNVDEFDAVRYDGEHLYIAPRRYYDCCFLLAGVAEDGAAAEVKQPERSIRILATNPDDGTATLASTIALAENISVQGMYLADDRMLALTGQTIYGSYGVAWADFAVWAPEKLGYQVYDIGDPSRPELLVEASIDGVFVDSRRIGDTVYLVSRYSPRVDGLDYHVTTPEQETSNEATLAGITLEEMLPKITVNGVTSALVDPDRCYISNTDEPGGYPVITSMTAIPISNPGEFTTTCYNEEAYGLYVSENALYFTQGRAAAAGEGSVTRIHKFALAGTEATYRGSVDIAGDVWRGGQADFRMSEQGGDLRVLASQFNGQEGDFVDHKLYVIRQASTGTALTVLAQLPNEQRPQEIGKPNEALYGVRFLADRAYAVTFERIDPLYVIDLSDPADPSIAGELAVTGFSDFLHPVSEELLLGLGVSATGGIKLELFDVSAIAAPQSRGSVTLGGPGSWSEATYDRHAFTYQADVDGGDRLAIPAQLAATDGSYELQESGLYLFEIQDKATPASATLDSAGALIPLVGGVAIPYYAERNRAFIHGDTVFYVRDESLWGAFWDNPSMVNGPY